MRDQLVALEARWEVADMVASFLIPGQELHKPQTEGFMVVARFQLYSNMCPGNAHTQDSICLAVMVNLNKAALPAVMQAGRACSIRGTVLWMSLNFGQYDYMQACHALTCTRMFLLLQQSFVQYWSEVVLVAPGHIIFTVARHDWQISECISRPMACQLEAQLKLTTL